MAQSAVLCFTQGRRYTFCYTLPLSFLLFPCDFLTLTAERFWKKNKNQNKTSKHKHKNAKSLKPQDEGRERALRTKVSIIFGASAFCSICQILQLSSAPLSKRTKNARRSWLRRGRREQRKKKFKKLKKRWKDERRDGWVRRRKVIFPSLCGLITSVTGEAQAPGETAPSSGSLKHSVSPVPHI